MSSDNQNLEQLWQQQPVQNLDIEKIEKQFKGQRWKQRCYVIADIASMLPIAYILLFMQEKMSELAFTLIVIVGFLALVYVATLIYFRRHAAFFRSKNTQDFLQILRKQIHNNVLIARLTRYFCWVVFVGMSTFYGILYWNNELKPERWLVYVMALVFSVVSLTATYIWAQRREKRFEAEATRLNSLTNVQ
ncbi:hypothetical protein OPS25_10630 [Alteromonas ponticola]|uniref:DUF3278 domain-containing protein n=1 Tax=Alteromonas aquimaris TaxID=2998417 RepID=A0ABT3P861_9ALTE|nr:hypothetical protein [Alteromonas aquimaris]MCW8108948.1 hypothetical protein [Alteromonas aquimaris]